MNDDSKNMSQDVSQVAQPNQVQQPFQDQAQSISSVGSGNKEMGPVGGNIQLSELRPSGAEVGHELSQEIRDMGVEEKKDGPELTPEHREIGVNQAGPSIPAQTAHTGKVNIMTQEEMVESLKSGDDIDSRKGLARLLDKIMKAANWLAKG